MELYLSACSKAADSAAAKTATSGLAADSRQCGDGAHKTHFQGIGAAQLLDLPLGVKLPMIPGSNTVFYTTNLSEKLVRPSYGFNLTDPYCRLLENQYKSLHDPHLKAYYRRKDILRRLRKGGYITSSNKIVCTLRELNNYRQYLTSLKLDFERNYIREQKMLAKQVNKLQENNQSPESSDVAQFQNWLLRDGMQSRKDQEQLIRHRYLDMISRELEQLERTAEEQRLIQMDREERRQREHTRRKLSLRKKIEEEWKTKEMLLLTKIGEDVKREARIEEQRRRSREESDRKKQALLEKKMAYHLQKMQEIGFNGEEMEKTASPKKKKKTSDDVKLAFPTGDQKAYRGINGPLTNAVRQSQSSSKYVGKKSATSIFYQPDVQDNGIEQKKDGVTIKKSGLLDDKGAADISAQASIVSAQLSPMRNFPRPSQSSVGPPKEEAYNISFAPDANRINEKELNAESNERPAKRSSCLYESGSQVRSTAQGIFSSHVGSNTQQNLLHLQEKVTSEELNSIIQNIMTWVVATVTSILYPAITKYEERLQNNTYPVSDDSIFSSDSSSLCSTCSEEFTYGSYTSATTKTFQTEPCTLAVGVSVRQPTTSLKPPSAHKERTVVGKTYHRKVQSVTSDVKYNKARMIHTYPTLRNCKSDSQLLASFETGTKKSKDAATETDGLENPVSSDQKTKAINEVKNLKNVFVNFKCHLKGETEMILESIFQEIMSDLTQAIPSLSSVTAEVFVDHGEAEKRDLLSNADICSVAAEIVENMLEKLESAVEKKCVKMFSQEDLSVHSKPDITASREYFIPSDGEILRASSPYTLEPMCDIAEDMVHSILEKLMTLASCKQNELPRLEDTTKLSGQQQMTDPTHEFLQRADRNKSSTETGDGNLIANEEIQNLMSNVFSQSSLVGYIEEAISTILGYVQTELNNERLIASEETVVLLQLLDDIFTHLRPEPVKAAVQKGKCPRLRNLSDTEEKYRLTGTRVCNEPKSGRPFPPINVPGMVLYSEDDNEEIEKIVKNVLDSSVKNEKAKLQGQIPNHQFTKGNVCFQYKKDIKPPTVPDSQSKVAFRDWGLKTDLPSFNDEELLKKNPCMNKDILIFSQDEKQQIQKASENIVKSILTEMIKDRASVHLGHLDSKNVKEASVFASGKPQCLSHQEWMDQMFSASEISAVAQEITDAVLNILYKASSCIPNTITGSISTSVQTSLGNSDIPHMVKAPPNKKPLKIWFDSEKKVKYLSSLNKDPAEPSLLQDGESGPNLIDDISDKIINTIFKKLKLFVCPKLQMTFKPVLAKQSALRRQLSAYTSKVVNIVLHAIQNELELSKKNVNTRDINSTKIPRGFSDDADKLEPPVTNFDDDFMASPLITCICEILSSRSADQSNVVLPSNQPRPETSYKCDTVDEQNILPRRQEKKSIFSHFPSVHGAATPEIHKCLATPCSLHSVCSGKDLKEYARLQVLDRIGETLCEMLCNLIGIHPFSNPSSNKQNREKANENQQMTTTLQSNIQLISKTILKYILEKLCSVDMDNSLASPGNKAVSEDLDIDSLPFDSIIEEMARCIGIISSMVSRIIQEGNKEELNKKAKTTATVSSKTGSTKEMHSNKLKAVASDIFNMVFAKLEGFANRNLETLDAINDGNEKSNNMDWECESPSISTDTHEKLLQSALYMHAKKVSSTILKAVQTELNVNSADLRTSVKNPPPEKQMLKNTVNLILDAASSNMFDETESERDFETYRYKPTYGNFLPGGAESDSFVEDAAHAEKECTEEKTPSGEETKSDSLKQWVLERTLNKIEVELKEPQKSPVVPIIRNILNEIFQNALVNQLNMFPLPHSHLSDIPHNIDEPVTQTSFHFMDKMAPLVSEADVTIVADDVVTTVFHKLYSAAMTERNASEDRYKSITFSANVSFYEHTSIGKSSVTMLDRNPCTCQSGFNIDKQAKVNVVEDIIQTVLTNLETFATSKVKSLFCPQVNFTVPLALPLHQDKSMSVKTLSAKDPYSEDQFSCYSVDEIKSENTNSMCQLSLSKLNTYAIEVTRKILQGIKRELDKETESPTHNVVVSENIASQIVNTVLDIVSSKGKCVKSNSDEEIDSNQQEGFIEKLFHTTEYRKVLQFQIQDTIEGVLRDIYEKTLDQNNLLLDTPTLKCNMDDKDSGANSEMFIESANKSFPKLSIPKSDVVMISSDIVDIVLHNLSSAVMLGINTKDYTFSKLPLSLCEMLPRTECQQLLFQGSKCERKTVCFPFSGHPKSAPAEDNQSTRAEEEDNKKSVPDSCEENANFITKTIFNRLESFATERIDSLITLAFQTKKSFVSSDLENCKQNDSVLHESSQTESDVTILKLSTAETILGKELTDSTFASYREKLESTIPLSQAHLKEYAVIIASAILKLIKNDLDLEIQKMYPCPENISFQENIFASEIINNILKILYNKRSIKETSFYAKQSPIMFSQLTVSDTMLLDQREKKKNAKLSLFSKSPLEQNQVTSETESQIMVLEEVFMRSGESRQKEKIALISAVEEVLNKVSQRVVEVVGHLPPCHEIPHSRFNSKIKISDITHKKSLQSQINRVANDIVESVLGKMYSVVVTPLNVSNKSRGEVKASDNSDALPPEPSCLKGTKQAGKGNDPSRYMIPQVYPYVHSQSVSLLENTFMQYSPLQVGKDLVQMVLNKITNFTTLSLEGSSCPEGCPDDVQPLKLHSCKISPKGSPKSGFKANLKARSKVTSLPKFRTKPHLGPSGAKDKSKTKLVSGEKTPKGSRSKTAIGLPHILSTGDAKNLLETKLPTLKLKLYAKDIISNTLKTIMKEFEKVKQNRAMADGQALPSDQIMAASEIVNTVLQGLHVSNNHNLVYPIKFSHLDDPILSQGNIGIKSLSKPQACFFLENVSSQLEQIFPKEGIFKKMFDKWQTESSDIENEKYKLLIIVEKVLTEISIKAQELEHSVSLLNLPPPEACESRSYNRFKGASSSVEDSKSQVNMFGREIVEMLFEKLQLCFVSQMPTLDHKDIPAVSKEWSTAKGKYDFPTRHSLSNVSTYNIKSKDHISLGSSNQIVQEIIERILNMLESFVDLQFKCVSRYEFSEVVKMPIENFFPAEQRLLSKRMLPKLQPLKKSSDESKSSTISQQNIQNIFLQVHSFHSELLTYAANIVSDMLGIIKNKLDKEISQAKSSSINILEESIIASEIISTLMDQCSHLNESLIKNLPKESLFQRGENSYIVNQVELAATMKMPTSKLRKASFGNNLPQISVPDLVYYSEEDIGKKYRASSNLPSYIKSSTLLGDDAIENSEPMGSPDSETIPSCSRKKVQGHSSKKTNFSHFDQALKGNSFLPEGSILQKLFKKANDSTEAALEQVMSFIEMGKGENPGVFHCETQKPVTEASQIQTTVSPLKICLAAENIVNTVLSSYGFPNQPHVNESMETMKPIFISKQSPFSVTSEEQKNEERRLFTMWDKRNNCIPEEESKNPKDIRADFSLLHKWKNKNSPDIKKMGTLKEVEVFAFADHELGPNEIHLIARYVTRSIVTHFQNVNTRVSSEEKVSLVSTLSRKKYESNQLLRGVHRDSSLHQFCEHLTELVISHISSRFSDGTEETQAKVKVLESQEAAFKEIISIYSQVFESRSIPIGELVLSISEIIIQILFNSNIIKADITQQMVSIKPKYIYSPGVAASDLDDLFQDLLVGVIHVLSKEIGINHHLKSKGRNKSFSILRSHSIPICNKANSMERQAGSRECDSYTHRTDELIQKNKLNYLARKLDNLIGSLKTRESKEVVNKVFNIVLDLFLPDECTDDTMNSGKIAKPFFPSSNSQQSHSTLGNNLGLSPKSVFLLNVVCEKLITTLLEKCTSTVLPDNDPLSDEISAKECQLLKTLQSVEDEELDYCKGAMDCEPFQGDYVSDFLENLAEMDQDLLSSESVLTLISHSLVKSLMEKLTHSIQEAPQSLPFANKHLKHKTRQIQSNFTKAKRPELTELEQDKNCLGFMSYDSNPLTGSLNDPSVVGSKTPFYKQFSVKPSYASPFRKQKTNEVDTAAIYKMLYPGDMNAGVYSATFLEEIISELFFTLSTSWGKDANITETQLTEMNTLFVNAVVNELNKNRVMVLQNAEEKLYFPPVHKKAVTKIVNSVYNDVLQQYKLKVACGNYLAHDNTSIAKQITNGILLEIVDYQLPSYLRGKLIPTSLYPLKAEIILQKLQKNLREFNSQPKPSTGYSTMLSHSFLEDVIRRLLSQLIPSPSEASFLEKKYFMSSDFNEMSTHIIRKVMSAISKHKIWFTIYDKQYLCTGKNLQKMVDSVYSKILQMSDSFISIQKSIISQSPVIVDQIASFIIQEIIENHLQPFLDEESLPHPSSPMDEISNMVKQVLSEVTESHRTQKPSPLGVCPDAFVGKIVARLLSKISPDCHSEFELEKMTQKIVNSINNHFEKLKISILHDDKEQSFPSVDTDIVDELVTSIYKNVLKQNGLDPEVDKESKNSENFVENIANLIIVTISDYLLHPLFSGDLLASSYSTSKPENTVQGILSTISKSTTPHQSLSPYNTLLPYMFLEDMIRVLLCRIFPSASSVLSNRDRSGVNFNEIASNLISNIRRKISQHEILLSKDEEETKCVYSDDYVQRLVDSVFKNIAQESVEQNISSSNDALIDRIAGFIIKNICQQHLQPFVDGKSLPTSLYTNFDDERRQVFYASVYSAAFLEDVVSGVLSKIFHRMLGIVQTKSVREDELFKTAEKLIYLITGEFSTAQVSVLENAEKELCLPPLDRDIVIKIIDMVYSKVLQEYEMEIIPNKDFLNDTEELATRVTKTILAEISDFQIHPDVIAKLPFKSYSKLSADVLIERAKYDISKSSLQRQASTLYTTMLSHTHLEKIVTQLISQMSLLASSEEDPDTSQSGLSNTVMKLINEIMLIISKHAICITKHGSEKQSMISEKDIQSMVDSIYADLSYSNLYQTLTKDKKGISSIPVSKIASFIIKGIFNHHIQSFLSDSKTLFTAAFDQTNKQKVIDPKQRELSLIVNSAVFLEEVISELLCKILYAFSHNVLAAENPEKAEAKITDIVTTLVKSIVLEFNTSEILVADNFDQNLCFSEGYKEMVFKTVNLIYENILAEYKSLVQVYRAIESDTICFGRKIYHLLLGEIYDYQVQSLVSGELVSSSYSSPRADTIIRNVLSIILKDSYSLPSYVTVLPRSLLEDVVYKLLVHIFPSSDTENEPKEEEVPPDYEFVDAASKLSDEIIKEISEHEIRLATAEENEESTPLEVIENLIDSICKNILKKSEFQAEVQKDSSKKGGPFLSKIAGFIMKEIMDHHLKPFLHGEETSPNDLSDYNHVSVLVKTGKEKTQSSLYSATFLENVIVNLVHKFCSLPSIAEDSKKKEIQEPDIVGLAIKFANALIGEFRKSEIKVLPNAEEMFCFPPIDKEIVDKISNFVYDQFIGNYGSNDIQKNDKSNVVIEMISALTQKAISAFKIQPLFSGDWSSMFFSFLNPDNVTQRVQHLPQKTSTQINRSLKEKQLILPKQSCKHACLTASKKNTVDPLEIDKDTMSAMESFKNEETKNKKKEDEKKMDISIEKCNGNLSKITFPSTGMKSQDTQKTDPTFKNNEIEKKNTLTSQDDGQGDEDHTQISLAVDTTKYEKVVQGPDDVKESNKSRESSFKKDDKLFKLSSLKSKERNKENTMVKTLKVVSQKPNNERKRDSLAQTVKDEGKYMDYECVQNVIENIYDNVLEVSLQDSADNSKSQGLPDDKADDKALRVSQEVDKDFTQSLSAKDFSPSINKYVHDKEKMEEKEKVKNINSEPSKPGSQQYSSKNKPGLFPAKFLEDVITEMVNKLIFSSSPETQTHSDCQNVSVDENQAELYDTAMKLIDSLLKEFSDAQIKVFRPGKGNQSFPPAGKESSVHELPPRQKVSTTEKASPSIKLIAVDKIPPVDKMFKIPSSNKVPFQEEIPAVDKTLVNKVVHSSICNILKEFRSQDSICKNINSNRENVARRLSIAVIEEIFQHQLNLLLCDEFPAAACLPLESKDVVKKVQKVTQTASKECQTSSPYTIILPHEFLENVISSLLSKIFSTISNTKAEASEDYLFTDLDFLQVKLVSTIKTEISRDEDMIIQYVESLHPNDDEIIQLVVQSIYNNLLPQFGSQKIIQNCVTSGCRILTETIVELVLREVAGNQLQNYFSGELTPYQCAEIDNVVENILKDVIQTTNVPQSQPSRTYKLPYNIIEEIAVKFLSKLLSMFPKVNEERTKSLETEMQKITSKILNSVQEFMSKSQIKLVPPARESPTVPLADNATIEKVVNSIYTSVVKHSGSHTSIFKDLIGQSSVLSDIIGFLMVKEISNSEFQPQVEEEASSSELVLEAVQIMGKVIKLIDELKSQEKPSSRKGSVLDATFLEETMALLLAKLAKLPGPSSKNAKNLSKPELNKIACQLTKSVKAEISRSNISLVAADPEEHILNPESIEMISQIVDSVYSNVLKQSGTQKELYYDIKTTNRFFPKKVASLIIDEVSNFPLDRVNSKNLNADLLGDLDVDRIVQKTQDHVVKVVPHLEKKVSDPDLNDGEFPIKIVPHIGNKPIKIDPAIISQHLAVISVKTQPLERLQKDCLNRTGHSIAELRRASINGRSYSSDTSNEETKRERRISLNRMGRLDIKPLQAVCRNSFQNIRKPDITKVELLKDVESKEDLIIRLVAHDIDQENSETNMEEELTSDEEVVLGEVISLKECSAELYEDQVKEAMKPIESKVVSPKPTLSTSSLKKFLSLSKCCQPTSSTNIESIEETSNHITESKERQVKRAIAELDMATCLTTLTDTDSSLWEKKSQCSKEERRLITEPTHYFVHRIMSSSSYNQEDLISCAGETEDYNPDPSAKILEESSQEPKLENASSVKFITIYEGHKNVLDSGYPSKEVIAETPKTSISKQGSKVLTKVSSALSKVFSRSSNSISKSSSPPHRDEH